MFELIIKSSVLLPFCLFLVGLLAGFINIMAGGGSVLTLGMMILMGIDPQVANGTNRVALVAESFAGILSFKKRLKNNIFDSLQLSLWTIPGALLGAFYAVEIPAEWFQRILVLVILFVVVTILFPFKLPQEETSEGYPKLFYVSLVFIGFYGGFIQAGIGFVIMVCFRQIAGMSLLEINIHKVFLVLIYTLPVLGIFIATGNVNWLYAVFLGAGNFMGAWFSASVSVTKGDLVIKRVVALAMALMATQLLVDTL